VLQAGYGLLRSMKGELVFMETKRKIPLFIIGLISCFIIAIVGIIADFIADMNGLVAVISVLAAFVVFAVFIVLDVIRRKIAEKQAADPYDGASQINVPAEQQFLRHGDSSAHDFDPVASYGDYGDDDYDDGFEDEPDSYDSPAERELPSMLLRRRAAELRAEQEGAVDSLEDDSFETPAFSAPAFETEDLGAADDDDSFEDMADTDEAEDAAYEDQESFLQPETSYMPAPADDEIIPPAAPAPVVPSAPVPMTVESAPVVRSGQSLEAFFEDMSEEDILYRDCVQTWAEDAKPSVVRLMELVEGMEDKKAQVRFGREVEYVNAMVERIHRFTLLDEVDHLLVLKKHNFSKLVKTCLKRFSPFFMEKSIGLLWKGLDIDVVTDEEWFIFALTQVVFNAVEFTPQGGKIAFSAKKNGDFIDLIVDDSGKGISPEELPYVFIAGFMGDEAPNGSGCRTGMGLFITQSVLRKMGGDAFIESNYGKGTRVTLRVPAPKA